MFRNNIQSLKEGLIRRQSSRSTRGASGAAVVDAHKECAKDNRACSIILKEGTIGQSNIERRER